MITRQLKYPWPATKREREREVISDLMAIYRGSLLVNILYKFNLNAQSILWTSKTILSHCQLRFKQ